MIDELSRNKVCLLVLCWKLWDTLPAQRLVWWAGILCGIYATSRSITVIGVGHPYAKSCKFLQKFSGLHTLWMV